MEDWNSKAYCYVADPYDTAGNEGMEMKMAVQERGDEAPLGVIVLYSLRKKVHASNTKSLGKNFLFFFCAVCREE